MTHAIGIDLGTTYSCLAVLNEHGQPTTIPNQEGELSTPSVVFFDDHETIVGTEALRNAIAHPDRVIQNAKRFIGDPAKSWQIDGETFSPQQVSTLILRKLIAAAQDQLGAVDEAVITVPAQFSDAQRNATVEAGKAAGLKRVEIINEPVAAALCYVLGSEGLAFAELAIDQQLLVFDLGGGTLDLAIVSYSSDEVRVVASDGDLELGGLDRTPRVTSFWHWKPSRQNAVCLCVQELPSQFNMMENNGLTKSNYQNSLQPVGNCCSAAKLLPNGF